MNRMCKMRRKGVTFVEMLATAVVVMVVGSMLFSVSFSLVNYNKDVLTQDELEKIKEACLRYYLDMGAFPAGSLEGLIDAPAGVNPAWRGPYIARSRAQLLNDAWNRAYQYVTTRTPAGVDVALVVSAGKNGVLESDVAGFNGGLWDTGGDDLATLITSKEVQREYEELTRLTLTMVRSRLLSAHPDSPPLNYSVPQFRDAWETPLQYVRCNPYSAVIYSYGANRQDNSVNGVLICAGAPIGDDLYTTAIWELRKEIPPGQRQWTGGLDVNPVQCAKYTLRVTNRYGSGAITVKYDNLSNTATVNAGQTVNITTNPRLIEVYKGSILLDRIKPQQADLNSDCVVAKNYGL